MKVVDKSMCFFHILDEKRKRDYNRPISLQKTVIWFVLFKGICSKLIEIE